MSRQLEEIRKGLDALDYEQGAVYELRAVGVPENWSDKGFVHSGYFDDLDALAAAAVSLDRKGAKGTYVTQNPVLSDLLARAKNRVVRSPKTTTNDEEILRRERFFVDVDAEHPAGISATDEEKQWAFDEIKEIRAFLRERGWPEGILCDSANGAHLQFAIDLPADDKGLIRRVLKALAERFNDERVTIDTTVHNAARVCKLYGTTARKGDPTDERPHRRARILDVPDQLEPVTVSKLQALAQEAEEVPDQSRSGNGLPTEEIRRALSCIQQRQDYGDWFRLGTATLDACGGDIDTAVQLLKEWSPEEEPGEYRKKLTSGLDGSISTGTLIHVAKEHGYAPPWERNGHKQKRSETNADGEGSEDASHKEETQAERLLHYAEDVELFHTPDGEAYASFEAGGAYHTAAISSAAFGKYLRRLFYQAERRPPSSQALQDARDVLAARAEFDGEETEVHLRVAGHDGKTYIDLADDRSNIVEIDAKGWRIVRAGNIPVKFRWTPGMKALPEPRRGGGLDLLRSHVRLASDGEFALLLAWLVQSLRPDGRSYPGLELTGEQGSGKTFTAKLLRAIIDPHRVPTRTRPREERDLMVAAHNSWILSFDNLSGLPHWLSDALCRLATGGGFGTRKLYSDRTEEIFYAKRPLILNGIEDLTTQPDLADRTITLRLEPIPESERRTEAALQEAFEQDRPLILGALFDAVATALKHIDNVELDRLPRMADFACWGVAAEPAFPVEEGTFMKAYDANRAEASEEAVANDTVAAAIQRMLSKEGAWEGIMSELLVDLKDYLPNPERPPRDFPDTHQAMTARLHRVLPALRAVGIDRQELPRTSNGRPFRLYLASAVHDAMDGATSANRTGRPATYASDPAAEIDSRGKTASLVSPRHRTPPAGAESGSSSDTPDDTSKEARQGVSERDTEKHPSRASDGENDAHDAHDTVLPHQSKPVLADRALGALASGLRTLRQHTRWASRRTPQRSAL